MTEKFFLRSAAAAVLAAFAVSAAAQVFTIRDIRVEGIQRTEPGTVFSHLPFTAPGFSVTSRWVPTAT